MSELPSKLSTSIACRVAGLDRVHFNEALAKGAFNCAPKTNPGRARYFDPDDVLALRLYRDLFDDGFSRAAAGRIACEVARAARENPDTRSIAFVNDYFSGGGNAYPADSVPAHGEWDDVLFSGTDIRKVTTFRIGKMRDMIAHYTAEELSHFGND